MNTTKNASDFRRVIQKIIDTRIDLRRPNIRVGRVYSIDLPSQTAMILFPENDVDNLVPVRFALDRIPSEYMDSTFNTDGYDAGANVVRIAGRPGAWFILDFVAGIPQSSAISDLSFEFNIKWNEEEFIAPGPGSFFVDLEKQPLDSSEKLFWETLYQDESQWLRSRKSVFIEDSDGYLKSGDKLVYRYAYEDLEFEEVVTYDAMPRVGSTAYEDGSVNGLSLALPAGVQSGDLLVLGLSGSTTPTCTDRRMRSMIDPSAPNKMVYYGYADDVQDAISDINLRATSGSNTNLNGTAVLAVYRGLVVDTVWENYAGVGRTPSSPFVGEFGIVVVLSTSGTVAGTSHGDTIGIYSRWTWENDYKAITSIYDWFSKEGPTDAPLGNFGENGTYSASNFSVITIKARPVG